jgi:hypothetical protein
VDPVKKRIKIKKDKAKSIVNTIHHFGENRKKIVRFLTDKRQKLFLKYGLPTFLGENLKLVQLQIGVSKFYFELVTRKKHLQVRSVQVMSGQVVSGQV